MDVEWRRISKIVDRLAELREMKDCAVDVDPSLIYEGDNPFFMKTLDRQVRNILVSLESSDDAECISYEQVVANLHAALGAYGAKLAGSLIEEYERELDELILRNSQRPVRINEKYGGERNVAMFFLSGDASDGNVNCYLVDMLEGSAALYRCETLSTSVFFNEKGMEVLCSLVPKDTFCYYAPLCTEGIELEAVDYFRIMGEYFNRTTSYPEVDVEPILALWDAHTTMSIILSGMPAEKADAMTSSYLAEVRVGIEDKD